MSLVGKVGRKRFRARFATAVLYLFLIIGALTTVYPFLFMATTGFKGPTDQNDNKLLPAFWSDSDELLKKYRDDKYSGDVNVIASYAIGADGSQELVKKYEEFLMKLPPDLWRAGFRVPPQGVTSRLAVRWQTFLRKKYESIDALNKAYVDLNQSFQQIPASTEAWERKSWKPPETQKWRDWMEFKESLPAEFRVPVRGEWVFQEWLRSKFKNRIEDVPADIRGTAKSFAEVRWNWLGTDELNREFAAALPPRLSAKTPELAWSLVSSEAMPIAAFEAAQVHGHGQELKSEFSSRNYRYVLDYVALHGQSLWNTLIFCGLAILTQLTVNPLAAYALSRFPMKATAKILLFLLATMAFPAEVAMIPSFLLLKDLGLLNTFAALVLPTAASGYTIYLLKGFFDSLPQEIFDSGQVDGAPEWKMMLRLAFPLSKPVLGYIALLAFMGAYGSFIYAFLVCQDSRMWTLMVFVYQLQITSPKAVVMAAVTIAAIPTLVVFLACQKVIMRGIVLPGER